MPTAADERSREMLQHLGHLDALRGVAVLAVLSHHAGIAVPNRLTPYVSVPGVRGLQLFFVLSAFTLLLSSQKRGEERYSTLFFFIRRFFRLAPLYYLMILAMVLVEPIERLHWRSKWPAIIFAQNLSVHNYGAGPHVGWSLSVEVLFYLFFPALNRWITTLRSAVLWLGGSLVATTALWVTMSHIHPDQGDYWSYFSFAVQFPTFLLGFACFFIWRDYLVALKIRPESKWLSASLLFFTVVVLIAVIPLNPREVFFNSIFVVTLLLSVCLYEWPFLVNRVTIFLGKISYSIYLVHGLIQAVTMERFRRATEHSSHSRELLWLVYFVWLVASSVLVSYATHRLVEEPGIRWGKSLISRIRGTPASREVSPPLMSDLDTPEAQF